MNDNSPKPNMLSGVKDYALILTFLGMVGTSIGWFLQYQQTQEAEKRSYSLSQFEEFKTSAEQLDNVTAKLFDAIAEDKDTLKLRAEFNEAYRSHVIQAESDRDILGIESTERYLEALGVLRDEIELSVSGENTVARVEALGEVIVTRRNISEKALGT